MEKFLTNVIGVIVYGGMALFIGFCALAALGMAISILFSF